MWLKNAILLCCVIACALSDENVKSNADERVARAVPIEEFVTSHKVPDSVLKPPEDEDDDSVDVEEKTKDGKLTKKVIPKFEVFDKKPAGLEPIEHSATQEEGKVKGNTAKRQAAVELENFGDTGVLQEDGLRKNKLQTPQLQYQKDSFLPGVQVSAEYPTTMVPVLTTPREVRSFDFVPVNIIREDSKDVYSSFSDRNFGDLGDVSLVPAGTNSRIQVKKGPNGKDYEYEYVYYYYDEEDESKAAGTSVASSHESPARTTTSPRRGASNGNGRNKYSNVERSSTVEPATNEVIPNRNSNRGRQLAEAADDVSEERLPTNTRFPPRSRSNHNTATTEANRGRGNRLRPSLDLVDSSSFRTHQEGPEFPTSLPKGPVRFLGVTPNEDNDEKSTSRIRGRPQKVQDSIPVVEEPVDDVPAPTFRRRPASNAAAEAEIELSRGQPARPVTEEEEEEEEETSESPKEISKEQETSAEEKQEDSSSPSSAVTTENPTTEYPSAMDKVALDLYAFLQQGQSNLVDSASSESNESNESTTLIDDEMDLTTDPATTTELSSITTVTTEPSTTTTTTTEPTTTTTTTTEPPTTTTQATIGRGKFRRPGVAGGTGTRNRFKSGSTTTTTEAPAAASTARTRNRFGGNGSNGFKRPRPGQKQQPVEEDTVQKESVDTVSAEKPAPGRGRYRGTNNPRTTTTTTTAAPGNGGSSSSGGARPTFNKLNINRRRGRPTTAAPTTSEEGQDAVHSETGSTAEQAQETGPTTPKSAIRARLPGAGNRPIVRPGARVNLRQKPGQTTTTTTTPAAEIAEGEPEEPAGEGTEEETHEAPAETSPPVRSTTVNPLNKLRNRNRLQVQPKTTTRSPVALTPRRSPLLPRRKVTEAPVTATSQEVTAEEEISAESTESTEATSAETSTAASTKHEETRGLGGLLAPRRRIAPRRPGQIVSRE